MMKIAKSFFLVSLLLVPLMSVAMQWTTHQLQSYIVNYQAQQTQLTQQFQQFQQQIQQLQQQRQQLVQQEQQIQQYADQTVQQYYQAVRWLAATQQQLAWTMPMYQYLPAQQVAYYQAQGAQLVQQFQHFQQQIQQLQQQRQQLEQQEQQVQGQINRIGQQYQQVGQWLTYMQQQLVVRPTASAVVHYAPAAVPVPVPAVAQVVPPVVQIPGAAINSFAQWKQLCDTNSVQFDGMKQNMQNLLARNGLRTFLSAQEFGAVLQAFEAVMQQEFNTGRFLQPNAASPTTLADLVNNTHFAPFVQKMIVPGGTFSLSCGDIHGDIWALNAYIAELIRQGYINDYFVIQNPNLRLIFQGDYVDGGWHGAEVLYLLMRLKIANQDKVIILRGNHEEQHMNEPASPNAPYFPFSFELNAKYNNLQLSQALYSSYRLMPVAAYVGVSGANGDFDYALHAHAYIEIGFNPLFLLNEPHAQFAFVPVHMDRNAVFTNILNTLRIPLPAGRYSDRCTELKHLGFCYGDISIVGNPYEIYNIPNSNFYTVNVRGQAVTEGILNYYNNISQWLKRSGRAPHQHTIHMLVRGHQHVAQTGAGQMNPLFPQVIAQGYATVWQPPMGTVLAPNGVWQGEVVSLWSSPAHQPWNHFGTSAWRQQTAVILQLNAGFNNWGLQGFSVQVP